MISVAFLFGVYIEELIIARLPPAAGVVFEAFSQYRRDEKQKGDIGGKKFFIFLSVSGALGAWATEGERHDGGGALLFVVLGVGSGELGVVTSGGITGAVVVASEGGPVFCFEVT